MNIRSGGVEVFYLRNYKSTAINDYYQGRHDVQDGIVIQ